MTADDRTLRRIDDLDAAYIGLQGRIRDALDHDDDQAASALRAEASELTAVDADGHDWRILAPSVATTPRADFQFYYLYLRDAGQGYRRATRSRFADFPSLAATYATRVGGGWLAWVVRHAELISYVAAVAVGIGLWFLLGDLFGELPGVAVLIGMVVVAAALWLSTVRAASAPYREAQRLATVTRAAAVGVTGAIPWVATIEIGDLSEAGRIALTAAVVAVAAVLSFSRHPSPFTYAIALGAWIALCTAAAVVIAETLRDRPDELASGQLGALVGAAIAYPVATRVAHLRWIPPSMVFLTLAATASVLSTTGSSPSDLHTFDVAVLGALAAAGSWWSSRMVPTPFRTYHRAGAIAIAAAVVLLVIVRAPWDLLSSVFDWLGDVPLPVVLITIGAAVLVGVAIAIRIAMGRVANAGERAGPSHNDGRSP